MKSCVPRCGRLCLRRWLQGAADTHHGHTGVGRVGVAQGCSQSPRIVSPATAPDHFLSRGVEIDRVAFRRVLVIVGVVAVLHPLPDVTGQIKQRQLGMTAGKAPDRRGVQKPIFFGSLAAALGAGRSTKTGFSPRWLISPGIETALGSPGRVLPFGLGGEAFTLPAAECLGVVPTHLNHRVALETVN